MKFIISWYSVVDPDNGMPHWAKSSIEIAAIPGECVSDAMLRALAAPVEIVSFCDGAEGRRMASDAEMDAARAEVMRGLQNIPGRITTPGPTWPNSGPTVWTDTGKPLTPPLSGWPGRGQIR